MSNQNQPWPGFRKTPFPVKAPVGLELPGQHPAGSLQVFFLGWKDSPEPAQQIHLRLVESGPVIHQAAVLPGAPFAKRGKVFFRSLPAETAFIEKPERIGEMVHGE